MTGPYLSGKGTGVDRFRKLRSAKSAERDQCINKMAHPLLERLGTRENVREQCLSPTASRSLSSDMSYCLATCGPAKLSCKTT